MTIIIQNCSYTVLNVTLSSGLLSSENGGIRQSNKCPSSRSIRNVPLKITKSITLFGLIQDMLAYCIQL